MKYLAKQVGVVVEIQITHIKLMWTATSFQGYSILLASTQFWLLFTDGSDV